MLSIGAFSKISNVTTKTLRYYDEIGLIKPVHVDSENGYRYYAVEQFKTMLLINKLKQYRFSLEEISAVLNRPDPYNINILFPLLKQKQHHIQNEMHHYQYILDQLENDISNLERGIHMMSYLDNIQVKLIETQPKNILFTRDKINIADYSQYIGKLFDTIAKEKLTITGAPMTIFHDAEFNPEHYDIEIAIPVKEAVKGTREFPGSLCALSTLNGSYTELTSIYAMLKQWIEEEGYNLSSAPYEIYLTDPSQVAPEDNVTEIYFPVKK